MAPKKSNKGIPPLGEKALDTEKKHGFEPQEGKESRNMMFLIISVLLILIIVGVAVIFFLFISKFQPPPPPVPPNITNITNITNVTAPGCDDDCMLQLAISTSAPALCDKINVSSVQQSCFVSLANISLATCLKVTNSSILKDCVIFHAVSSDDIGICSNLQEPEKTDCISEINPCFAKEGTERRICSALDKNDYSLCERDEECLFAFSEAKGTTSACEEFESTAKEQACKSIALNRDLCYDLPYKANKDLCYYIYANRTDDGLVCTMISPESTQALGCLSHFAVKDSDLSLCDYLSLDNVWSCYSNYSISTGDLSGCLGIHKLAVTARFKCFYDFAKLWGDPSACDPIGNPGLITTCYVGSIMNNTRLDYTTCSGVDQVVWKNKCYMQSAKLKNDPSICNYIATESERKNCISEVG